MNIRRKRQRRAGAGRLVRRYARSWSCVYHPAKLVQQFEGGNVSRASWAFGLLASACALMPPLWRRRRSRRHTGDSRRTRTLTRSLPFGAKVSVPDLVR